MQAADWEADPITSYPSRRARRAVALISASVIAISAAAVMYVRPSLLLPGAPGHGVAATANLQSAYQVAAIDFVSPTSGWVVADFGTGQSALIHTADAGATWTRQLLFPSAPRPPYLKFFDGYLGVFALAGAHPLLDRTSDGGRSWTGMPFPHGEGSVLSWSFVDAENGWFLLDEPAPGGSASARLWRTDDGGFSWGDQGNPILSRDQAFEARFSYLTTGWLASVAPEPYAYKTIDFGATWARVPLPAPPGGWPAGGQFVVAVQPLTGAAAIASVVFLPPIVGRSGVGATVEAFPPLTVRVFDGGKPDTYTYQTGTSQLTGGPPAGAIAPNDTLLRTLDGGATWAVVQPPSTSGALGYSSDIDWWWIGSGAWSKSSDGGVTWSPTRNIGVVEPLPGSLVVLDEQHAWFAASAGRRPLLETTDDGGVVWDMVMLPPIDVSAMP